MSATLNTIHGIAAPPTIAVFKMPEPSPVSCPSSAMPLVKMQGNMIELNRPTDKMDHRAAGPLVRTEIVTSNVVIIPHNARTADAFTFCTTPAPINRPTTPPPQQQTLY